MLWGMYNAFWLIFTLTLNAQESVEVDVMPPHLIYVDFFHMYSIVQNAKYYIKIMLQNFFYVHI